METNTANYNEYVWVKTGTQQTLPVIMCMAVIKTGRQQTLPIIIDMYG